MDQLDTNGIDQSHGDLHGKSQLSDPQVILIQILNNLVKTDEIYVGTFFSSAGLANTETIIVHSAMATCYVNKLQTCQLSIHQVNNAITPLPSGRTACCPAPRP